MPAGVERHLSRRARKLSKLLGRDLMRAESGTDCFLDVDDGVSALEEEEDCCCCCCCCCGFSVVVEGTSAGAGAGAASAASWAVSGADVAAALVMMCMCRG